MSRLPIRLRLTAAFALAMVVVLSAVCVFVYVRLRSDLDEGLTTALRTRAGAAAALVEARGPALSVTDTGLLSEADESFAQVVSPDGRVLAATGAVRSRTMRAAELREASGGMVIAARSVPGLDEPARIFARAVPESGGSRYVVVGQSLEDRNEALAALLASFAVGGPLAVLLASIIGLGLASAGLAPVEAMRRRATEISLSGDEERLPLPAAHDEVRRLGETLNAMLDRLRRSFERERRFVADASHELRTPVAVIKTELEGALRSGDLGPDARQSVVAAVEECDRLAQLAEDLLVLARAADGRLPMRPEPVRVTDALEGARDRFGDRAARHAREIRIECPEELTVSADPLRLRQALGNLVDNALRHGAGDVVLAARRADGGVDIDVSDHGEGFPSEMTERAFERFTRGDEARSGEGAGLGLAIVRAIAEAHGGRAAITLRGGLAGVRIRLPDRTPQPGRPDARVGAAAVDDAPSQAPLM